VSLKRIKAGALIFKGTVSRDEYFLKSNTVAGFKIISGLRNNFQSHRQLPECRNKQFEVGYRKAFSQFVRVFIEASYFSITRQQTNFKTIGAYKESTG
jgi:hypothetical protein